MVTAIKKSYPDAHVRVLLSGYGPLNESAGQAADELVVRGQCVLRKAVLAQTLFKLTLGLPYYLFRAWKGMIWADFVYINTVVDAAHLIASRAVKNRVAIHVREIPTGRSAAIFKTLCAISGGRLIYNSRSTAEAFSADPEARGAVIHNGVDPVDAPSALDLPTDFSEDRPLRLLMLGRINNWKGQDLLIEAISRLPDACKKLIELKIVGSTYMDVPEPIDALKAQVAAAGLGAQIAFIPFTPDTDALYRWADLSLVPSRQPEPFGRVAIEAMAHGRPVIAAAHGGLTEIVDHAASGWLFPPNDADALAEILRAALANPAMIAAYGDAALARFNGHFSTATMSDRVQSVLRTWFPALS